MVLIKRTTNPNVNQYKILECGHVAYLQPTHVRREQFVCVTCYENSLVVEAYSKGWHYVCATSGTKRLYIRDCKHLQEVRTQALFSSKNLICKQCVEKNHFESCIDSNYEYVGNPVGVKRYIRFKNCGHTKLIHPNQIRSKKSECNICLENTYKAEAKQQGLVYIGLPDREKDSSKSKRKYKLPCGCIKDLRLGHVRSGNWCCEICESTHLVKPSNVYLLSIRSEEFSFIKLGYAKNIKTRISGYSLSKDFEVSVEATKEFATGFDALIFENSIHKKYREFNLNKKEMKKYMENGHTECYPVELLEQLKDEVLR